MAGLELSKAAEKASRRAASTGKPADHEAAAMAHRRASKAAFSTGDGDKGKEHHQKAKEHDSKASASRSSSTSSSSASEMATDSPSAPNENPLLTWANAK